ncbi:YLP motif-containing protein 1 isoform X1 [Astyanax mexicanus]|uniref:YLP motif-containing protein 1 n=1 Tax=Astyanax mexicanus TaxID=7994 RepID=A0A8B9RLT5_ASTMX|nr:YLP motif-containing protein 1 isoform X1 [Astyanax mexicanus]
MYPAWSGFGGAQQPPQPPFGPRGGPPRAAPPGGGFGGFGGYGAPAAPAAQSNFSSLHEQHLQQMQQLQQLHQRQLQSVLHHGSAGFAPGPASGPPPGPWQGNAGGFPSGPGSGMQAEGNGFSDPTLPPPPPQGRGPPEPPKQPAGETPQKPSEPPPEQQQQQQQLPPPEKTDLSSMSLQEQQEYWYKQHLQNLQKLKNEKARQNQSGGGGPNEHAHPAPPPPAEPPKNAPPPPPPKEEPPPPPPPEDKPGSVSDTGDPVEAARLQQLQAAAAQWQHVQQQRAGYQYQALMQEHAQLQQVLQQYQQVIQQPAHLQTMSLDMQLQHYEMQQQQFTPVMQEWDRHFKLWLEQFQAYPHKDQLHEYEGQWRQWQEQMNTTSAHLHERVTTLRTMQQQYSVSDPYGAMMGPYGQPRPPGPEAHMQLPSQVGSTMSPNKMDSSSGPRLQGPQSMPGSSAPDSGPDGGPEGLSEPYNPAGPPGPMMRQPGPHGRFEGPRGPRFEGPRGPRFEPPPPQRFGGPPRFDAGQQFGRPPRGNQIRPGPPGRFEAPPRQSPPSRFERPPGPHPGQPAQPILGSQNKPGSLNQTKLEPAKPADTQAPSSKSGIAGHNENKTPQDKTQQPSVATSKPLSDDVMDSNEGFFIQSDPIPQTRPDTNKKAEEPAKQTAKTEELSKDTSKTPVSTSSPVPPKPPLSVPNKPPQNSGSEMQKPNNSSNGPQQRPNPPQQGQFKPDMPNEPQEMMQPGPPHAMRGRGRGQGPLPMRGRGLSRGCGHFGGPMGPPPDPNFQENVSYDHEPQSDVPEDYTWGDQEQNQSIDGQGPNDMWQPEDHHFQDEYYEDVEEQGPPRGPPESQEEPWQEEPPEYWEEGDPYWNERHPPMHHRPPFPPGGPRRPPFQPRFMHHGPRRPPPPGSMEHGPRGPPHMNREFMGPRFRHGPGPGPWGPPPRHEMMGRGMRQPPLPHEVLEREPMGAPGYDEMEGEPGWPPHPHGREPRRPPMPPHEIIDRGMRRPPMRPPPVPRDRWRGPQPPHEGSQEAYEEEYGNQYGPEDEEYQRPPPDYSRRDYPEDEEYYRHPREDWERERPDRDFPQHPPHGPPERFREDSWHEGRERPLPFEDEDRIRAERRPGYADSPPYRDRDREPPFHSRSDWERPPPPPLPERVYPPLDEPGSLYERNREPHAPPAGSAPDPLDQSSPGAAKAVLALSQRQHEIILKAAQELKMIRELQESKKTLGDTSTESTGLGSEMAVGLLGLEIPPEVKSALQATNLLSETGLSRSLETVTDFLHGSSAPASTLIAKTVDYGHGHDLGAKVERISYGERIVLRPDPVPSDRYEKEPLGRRDPYYDRRSDAYADPRDYGREWDRERERERERERDIVRERPPGDYDRERYERERYERERSSRDERPPSGPSRTGYRERERDLREHPGRSSRDRELYSRPGYERSSYERSLERYDHGPSGYGSDRRSYPDERPPPAAPLPAPPPVPQRVEKKPETKNVEDILKPPGRSNRPDRVVIIMRGLPGSGKSHLAKLIRDKEVEYGGAPPRVLGLDDYFMTEVEKEERDPDTGKRVKTKVLEYEYEPEMEDTYRSSMLKTFKKTLDDGFFPFIILDAINDRVKYFDQFWSAAKTKGFEVYVAEISADHQVCSKRNIHGRKLKDITKLANGWESAPVHMIRLDIRSLLQDAAIEEVEMEDFNPSELEAQAGEKKEDEEEFDMITMTRFLGGGEVTGDLKPTFTQQGYLPKSKWEMDTSEAKLDKLDGLAGGGKRKRDTDVSGIEDFLQLPDDYASRMSEPGKKRVRWADLEEQKDADRKRAIGFVVGQTDWEKITDETGQLAQRALNRTKYF